MKIIKKILWAIFGNNDDYPVPDWRILQKPSWPLWFHKFHWLFIRNPLHNLTTYTLGLKGKDYEEFGRLKGHNFIPDPGGFNIRILLYKKIIPFPYISFRIYNGKIFKYFQRFELGWRDNGALGLAIKPSWWFIPIISVLALWIF